jgi:hypothetical protein
MGWNFTHLFESIIGGHYPRSITVTWILTELWLFLNSENSTLFRLLFYHLNCNLFYNYTSAMTILWFVLKDSSQLRNLWSLMNDPEKGVVFQSYRVRLRTYQKCIAGNTVVDWLLKQDKVANRFVLERLVYYLGRVTTKPT